MEDDYYYDDAGYDEYYDTGANEVADVDPLEVKYIDGKSYMQNNVGESLRCLREVLELDTEQGRWSFKALKMLARASRLARHYADMADFYARVAHFSHPDVTAAAVAKAMLKFTEESQQVPAEWRGRTLQATLEVATAAPEVYRDVIVPTLLRRATLRIEETAYEAALADLQAAQRQCDQAGAAAAQLHATARYNICTLQLAAYRKLGRFADLRRTYNTLGSVHAALPSLCVSGSAMESAGHLFLHDADWAAAHRAFSVALRNYTDSGDPQQHHVVKYVVLATMMAGLPADLFAQEETLANHAAVRPVRALWQAFVALDVKTFLQVLHAAEHTACFAGDAEFAPYMRPLEFLVRTNHLVAYVKSFAVVSLAELAARLQLEGRPCAELCTSAILLGRLDARIDEPRGLLLMRRGAGAVPSGVAALRELSDMTSELCCPKA